MTFWTTSQPWLVGTTKRSQISHVKIPPKMGAQADINGSADSADAGANASAREEIREGDKCDEDGETSSVDSFPSFDWRTELDMSSEEGQT